MSPCWCRSKKSCLLLALCVLLPYVIIVVCIQLLNMASPEGATELGMYPAMETRRQQLAGSHRGLQGLGLAPITRSRAVWKKVPLRPDCKPMQLANPNTTPLTALASFPGSGNTWLRHLIQQATGFYTGSVYNDYMLKQQGFPAERISNSSVIAVKTHEWPRSDKHSSTGFRRAILLIRDPYHTLVAEHNRRHGGHMGFAKNTKQSSNADFHLYSMQMSKAWLEFNVRWLNFEGPLHVVMYEDISKDMVRVVREVSSFLGMYISSATISCVKSNSEGYFHRGVKSPDFRPVEFTDDVRDVVDLYARVVSSSLALRMRCTDCDVSGRTTTNQTAPAAAGWIHRRDNYE